MSRTHGQPNRFDWMLAATRCVLGGWFLYSGIIKGVHPVEFLKALHEYALPLPSLVINATAAWLPWFEALCGLLLIAGKALRGTALICVMMVVPFTLLVLQRALSLLSKLDIPFCAVRFDCGCGIGEVGICEKLAENLILLLAALVLLFTRGRR